MYLLPCPSCQASISLSPSQAGDQVTCPACHLSVEIPNLSQLRQLPLAEDDTEVDQVQGVEISSGHRTGFVVLGLIATASLLVAGFCGIRWSLIEVEGTTEQHVADYREQYSELSPAQLIREYEQMEAFGAGFARPFKYKRDERRKNGWGRNASIAAAIGGLAVLGAFAVAGSGRRSQS